MPSDDDSGDSDEWDPHAPDVDLMDLGRGGLDGDSDTCHQCGADLDDNYSGEGNGGYLCSDCDDLSHPSDLEW